MWLHCSVCVICPSLPEGGALCVCDAACASHHTTFEFILFCLFFVVTVWSSPGSCGGGNRCFSSFLFAYVEGGRWLPVFYFHLRLGKLVDFILEGVFSSFGWSQRATRTIYVVPQISLSWEKQRSSRRQFPMSPSQLSLHIHKERKASP